MVLYEGINVWQLGYPQPNYTGPVDYTTSDPDITICSNGGCLSYLSTDENSPYYYYYNFTAGNTTYYGLPVEDNFEITKLDGVTYLLNLVKIYDAWDTNNTVIWRGANPYTVVYPMPDVNYTSISFDFNSSSGTHDVICVNGTCMMDFVRLPGVPEDLTNAYCNDFGMCYSYKIDNNAYAYMSIYD